jgi:hypothetical protein
MKQIAVENSHWIPYDAPVVVHQKRRAVCGELTDKHDAEPTCPECQHYLDTVEKETAETRFG